MDSQLINSIEDLESRIYKLGFLPFFKNDINGFSVSEIIAPEYWFPYEGKGVWEWKGPVIIEGGIAYGKFFHNKAGFISMEWFPDFLNYRRSIFQMSPQEKVVYETLKTHESLLSKELKKLCGYVSSQKPSSLNRIERQVEVQNMTIFNHRVFKIETFEKVITRLQMGTYLITADFEYNFDKHGKEYGWGISRYCTPEDFFGQQNFSDIKRSPTESYERILDHLLTVLPQASKKQIIKLIEI